MGTTLYRRFQRVQDYELRPNEVLGFVDGRWNNLSQARKVLRKIRHSYLTEEELVVLDLIAMEPPKSNCQIAEILELTPQCIRLYRKQIYNRIVSYGWWIRNEKTVCRLVARKLSRLHCQVLLPVVHRRTQRQISLELGVSHYCVYRKMDDCTRLLKTVPDFMTFLRSLRMHYR